MSLAIEVDDVTDVLLDQWYEVFDGSFALDSYEFIWGEHSDGKVNLMHAGGASGVCATGFYFKTPSENGPVAMAGPLTAIKAVRIAPTLTLKSTE